jgi:hypothetical protein
VYGSSSRSKWSGKKQSEAPVVKKINGSISKLQIK